jgi:serine/threonine-protein kinase
LDIEAIAWSFESAWWEASCRDGEPPRIESVLGDLPLELRGHESLELVLELASIDLEHRLKLDLPARVEDYLGSFAPLRRDEAIRDLVVTEFRYRLFRGEEPDLETYRERFPGVCDSRLLEQLRALRQDPENDPRSPRFRLIRLHREGGLGQIYQAFDRELGRRVALKRMHDVDKDRANVRTQFLNEARLTGWLDHPGIVPVHSLGQGEGDQSPYYAMRLVRGETLREAIRRYHKGQGASQRDQKMALRRLLGHFVYVCNTLAYAHSRSILHLDVKPANIMVGPYEETLLIDWGLARSTDRGSPSPLPPAPASWPFCAPPNVSKNTVMGTLPYMSPEQAAGAAGQLGPATDVYSLGATLYEILTGQPPFADARNTLEQGRLKELIGRGAFVRPRQVVPSVPGPLEAICLKAMAPKPEGRYPSAQALASEVERWLADEPVEAWPDPPLVRAWRLAKRHRTLVATCVAALVVAAIGLSTVLAVQAEAYRRLTAANQREKASRRLAQERANLALEAIATFTQAAGTDAVLGQPQFESLRKKLLNTPLDFYRRFKQGIEQSGDTDEKTRSQLGLAYLGLDFVNDRLGSRADARVACEQAVALYRNLAEDYPKVAAHRRNLAVAYDRLGGLQRESGHSRDARVSYERAGSLFRRLAAESPSHPGPQLDVAKNRINAGEQLKEIGSTVAAMSCYTEARSIYEKLQREHPEKAEYLGGVAAIDCSLSELLLDRGRLPEALQYARAARAGFEAVVQASPTIPDHRGDLATICLRTAGIQLAAARIVEARASYDRALDLLGELVRRYPTVGNYRARLANTRSHRANLLSSLGHLREAREDFEAARSAQEGLVADQEDSVRYRVQLAATLTNLGSLLYHSGQFDQAATTCGKAHDLLDRLPPDDDVVEHQRNLGAVVANLGNLQNKLGHPQEAETAYRRVHALFDRLAKQYPDRVSMKSDKVRAGNNLTSLLLELGRIKEAQAVLNDSIAIQERLLRVDGASVEYRSGLARLLGFVGDLHQHAGHLTNAIASYAKVRHMQEELLREQPEQAEIQRALARTATGLGDLARRAGNLAQANREFTQARTLFQGLVRDQPDNMTAKVDLAQLLGRIGDLDLSLGKRSSATQLFNEAQVLLREVVGKEPEGVESRSELAATDMRIGLVSKAAGQLESATTSLEEARRLGEELVRAVPNVAAHKRALAATLGELANLKALANDLVGATDLYRESQRILRELIRNPDSASEHRVALAVTSASLGSFLAATGRPAEAVASHEEACALFEELVRQDPNDLSLRSNLGGVLNNLGLALREMRRATEAKDAFDRAIEQQRVAFHKAPQVSQYRRFLSNHYRGMAQVQRDLRDPVRAVEWSLQHQALWPEEPRELYESACDLAQCIPLWAPRQAGADASAPSGGDRCRALAVDALRRSIAHGLRDPSALRDERLSPLRDTLEFQALPLDMRLPTNPFQDSFDGREGSGVEIR